jgi:light-regulated signal transduction histidine kinase (bacteriophytochrome)
MENSTSEIENSLTSPEETQRTIFNIMEDTEDEKNLLGNTQKAIMNILEDFTHEKKVLENTQKALLNILDDYSAEKKLAEETQRALINILEDYSVEKASIEKINIKLTRSNKEIEQFAYIASHDLQEPLKTLSNYVGLFLKKYKGRLDEDADQYLSVIGGATSRMQSLIKDLLNYSKVEKDKNKAAIDCNILLKDVLNDLAISITESKAEIYSEQLPIINGYLSGLKSLFQNLISNAVKFRKSNLNPIINITAQAKDEEWLFAIKDNGIGIDEIYYKKLFIVFQRLHNKNEYAGTGIGLAQCKKIIELHGGRIWLESELENGSTFYFTIPKIVIP